MGKRDLAIDPRGLIYESYRIEGIGAEECRSIFLDWALGQPEGGDMAAALLTLKAEYADEAPEHPMSAIIAEGLERAAKPQGRQGGRRRRN
jgi:hypothetical protein